MLQLLLMTLANARSKHHQVAVPKSRRGFTLAELMIVVVIMGILASLGTVAFRRQMNQSKKTEALAGLRAIGAAQESFRADTGVYLNVSTNLSTYYPPSISGGTRHFGVIQVKRLGGVLRLKSHSWCPFPMPRPPDCQVPFRVLLMQEFRSPSSGRTRLKL